MHILVFLLLAGAVVGIFTKYIAMRDRIDELERLNLETDQENIRLRKEVARSRYGGGYPLRRSQ